MTVFTDLSQYLQFTNNLNNGAGLAQALTNATDGQTVNGTQNSTQATATGGAPSASYGATTNDDRVRIAYLSGYANPYPGILAPLQNTQGMMFPYSPSIQISQEVDYGNMQMTHSNTNYFYYSRTPNAQITLAGKFTVQNQTEGQYAIAAIQFLRSVSKMNFGEKDSNAGLPPPILTLTGYGAYMFNQTRVFVKTHSYNYDENMDTVKVNLSSGAVRLPAMFTLNVTLVTQPTVQMMRTQFNLDDYRSGALLSSGTGFF